jgi:hypothetical protein
MGKNRSILNSHPVYTRYPHLKEKGPTDAQYTEWIKWFAWKPVTTIAGKKVWLKNIYKRERSIKWVAPRFPEGYFDRTEYAEWETIFKLKMRE